MQVNTIICGAMPGATKVFPGGYFNCSISSPPYWALRDYGVDGQLGLEPTFEEYIDKLCTIYDEVKRILRDDGTCWVNLGDTYSNNPSNNQGRGIQGSGVGLREGARSLGRQNRNIKTVPTKSLCLIPQRFAIEMVNRGWILRNVIIWHKPNPMPSSAKDRFTVDFEYVYFFVKSKKYWFEPQYDPCLTECNAERPRMGQGQNTQYNQKRGEHKNLKEKGQKLQTMHIKRAEVGRYQRGLKSSNFGFKQDVSHPFGRNKRTVWTIPTQPYPEAHFATFPEKLVEPMIKAGCPEFVCTKCGKAREKVYDYKTQESKRSNDNNVNQAFLGNAPRGYAGEECGYTNATFKGYTDCGCNAGFRPGIMIDIFAGSGTALQVAARLRRDWIGIELKPEYIKMAEKRVSQGETGISVKEQRQGQMALFEKETK